MPSSPFKRFVERLRIRGDVNVAGSETTGPRLRVCVIGLGGGGFHWEVQKIIRAVKRPLELVLVFAGPNGGIIYWDSDDYVKTRYTVRSPSLTGDSLPANVLRFIHNFWQALKIIFKEQPNVVLAVGTAQAIPFAIAARILHKPLWFVESITRAKHPSRTALWVCRFRLSKRFYYYWTDLAPYFHHGICIEEDGR